MTISFNGKPILGIQLHPAEGPFYAALEACEFEPSLRVRMRMLSDAIDAQLEKEFTGCLDTPETRQRIACVVRAYEWSIESRNLLRPMRQGMTKEQLADAQKFMVDLWQHIDDYMLATVAYDGVLCMGTGTQADQNAERDWFVQRRKLRDFIGLSPETAVPLYPGADMTRECDADGIPTPR